MRKKQDVSVAKSYMSYIFGNPIGNGSVKLAEAPFFADSRVTVGLQIADNFASTLYALNYDHYLSQVQGGGDYSHIKKYFPTLEALEFKSSKKKLFGYRVINHRTPRSEDGPIQDRIQAIQSFDNEDI